MTTDELLAQMENNPELYAETEQSNLIIDNDLRTITVPAGIKLLGVESDDDVNRLNFQMPKQYGEFDLSQFDIRINYMNAKNEGDVYAVEDKQIVEDKIEFSWLVGRNAVAYKGDTQFIVCLKKSDAQGIVQQEFNTTVAKLPVLQGLETTERVVQENPDIIEQILKKIDGLTEITPEDIAQAVDEYMTANPLTAADVGARPDTWTPTAEEVGALPDTVTTMPNPYKLSIEVNGATVEYDGSGAVTVTIPDANTERIEKLATDTVVELQPNKLYVFPEMATLTYTLAAGDSGAANEYHFVFQSGATATELVHPSGVNVGSLTIDANKIYEISVLEGNLTSMSWAVTV